MEITNLKSAPLSTGYFGTIAGKATIKVDAATMTASAGRYLVRDVTIGLLRVALEQADIDRASKVVANHLRSLLTPHSGAPVAAPAADIDTENTGSETKLSETHTGDNNAAEVIGDGVTPVGDVTTVELTVDTTGAVTFDADGTIHLGVDLGDDAADTADTSVTDKIDALAAALDGDDVAALDEDAADVADEAADASDDAAADDDHASAADGVAAPAAVTPTQGNGKNKNRNGRKR